MKLPLSVRGLSLIPQPCSLKASRPQKIVFAQVKKPIEGLLGVWAGIILQFKEIGRFFDGQAPFIFTGVGDNIPDAEEEYSGMRLSNE